MIAAIVFAALAAVSPLKPPAPSSVNPQAQNQANTTQERQDTNADKRGTESAPLVVQIDQPEGHEAIATKTREEGHWYAIPDWWVAGFTGVLFAATAGLWVVTWFLWQSTKTLVGDEQTYTKRELRAYVNVKEGGVQNTAVASITLRNFGQTPANDLKFWCDAVLCDDNHTPPYIEREGTIISDGISLAPQGDFKLRPTIRDIRTGTRSNWQPKFFAFGKVTYIDAFDAPQNVEFFLVASDGNNAFGQIGPHNKAT